MRILALGAGLLACACIWRGENPVVDGTNTRFTFLHTSDIHSRLFPFELVPNATDRSLGLVDGNAPYGGAARLGYLIRRERERSDRSLHLDSGDCFQGAPVFNVNLGEAETLFLSMVGLDAAVIGNHEFDAGVNNLVHQFGRWANFDVLAANYIFPDPKDPNAHALGDVASPYAIYNVKGVKVAVIGMANLGSLTSIGEGGNSLQINPTERNETLRSYVRMVHNSVDLVVVLSHLGLSEDEELITGYERTVWKKRMAPGWQVREDLGDGRVVVSVPGVPDVDVIIGGHLHIVLNPPKVLVDPDGREVVLAHSGAFAKYLGRLDVVLQSDRQKGGLRVRSHKYQVFPVDQRLAPYEEPAVLEMLQPYLLELNERIDLQRVVAYAPKTILRRNNSGAGDSALGNLVAESMRVRRRVEAEFALTNTLGMRDNFYKGPITLEDMFNVFPFENTLTTMFLSGYEVQELVDFVAERSASRACQSQAQVAGIRFTLDCAQVLENARSEDYVSPGQDIFINGRALNVASTYKVVVNDYIAGGGSGFRVLKRNTTQQDTGISMRDALRDYMTSLPRCGFYERYAFAEPGALSGPTNGFCDRSDVESQQTCLAIGDPERVGLVSGQAAVKGAYADLPCVAPVEDERIKRVVTEGLDTLEDPNEPEALP